MLIWLRVYIWGGYIYKCLHLKVPAGANSSFWVTHLHIWFISYNLCCHSEECEPSPLDFNGVEKWQSLLSQCCPVFFLSETIKNADVSKWSQHGNNIAWQCLYETYLSFFTCLIYLSDKLQKNTYEHWLFSLIPEKCECFIFFFRTTSITSVSSR